jgi:[ribosomal protein S5]-alanine N-acetyltransferase
VAVTRLLSVDDAEELASVVSENREFLAPWEPHHNDAYFTVDGQRDGLRRALDAYAREAMVPLGIVTEDGRLVGRISINGITRGGFQPFAIAPAYLKIAGRWQDHILFHLFNPAG